MVRAVCGFGTPHGDNRLVTGNSLARNDMAEFDKTEVQDDDEREDARQLSLQGNSPPSEIEGYSVVRRLGTGAYGTVWLAR